MRQSLAIRLVSVGSFVERFLKYGGETKHLICLDQLIDLDFDFERDLFVTR